MAPKIEKIWGAVVSRTAIRRKDSPDRDSLTPQQEHNQQDRKPADEQSGERAEAQAEEKVVDRATLEKALEDMRHADHFTSTGMRAEIVASGPALFVRFLKADGTVIKVTSAEDFMKLSKTSAPEHAPRGKILDQKF